MQRGDPTTTTTTLPKLRTFTCTTIDEETGNNLPVNQHMCSIKTTFKIIKQADNSNLKVTTLRPFHITSWRGMLQFYPCLPSRLPYCARKRCGCGLHHLRQSQYLAALRHQPRLATQWRGLRTTFRSPSCLEMHKMRPRVLGK